MLPGIQHDAMLQTKMIKHSYVPLDFKSPLDIRVGDNPLKLSEPKPDSVLPRTENRADLSHPEPSQKQGLYFALVGTLLRTITI